MRKLRDYFRNNVFHPAVNQQYVWFCLCYYMGMRGREGWRAFTKQSLEVLMDDQNKRYLAMSVTEATKNHQTPDDDDYSDDRTNSRKKARFVPCQRLKNIRICWTVSATLYFKSRSLLWNQKKRLYVFPWGKTRSQILCRGCRKLQICRKDTQIIAWGQQRSQTWIEEGYLIIKSSRSQSTETQRVWHTTSPRRALLKNGATWMFWVKRSPGRRRPQIFRKL